MRHQQVIIHPRVLPPPELALVTRHRLHIQLLQNICRLEHSELLLGVPPTGHHQVGFLLYASRLGETQGLDEVRQRHAGLQGQQSDVELGEAASVLTHLEPVMVGVILDPDVHKLGGALLGLAAAPLTEILVQMSYYTSLQRAFTLLRFICACLADKPNLQTYYINGLRFTNHLPRTGPRLQAVVIPGEV